MAVHFDIRSDKQVNFLKKVKELKLMNLEKIFDITFVIDPMTTPHFIQKPDFIKENGIKIAAPIDLLDTKLLASFNRTTDNDFIGITQLLKNGLTFEQGFQALLTISNTVGYSFLPSLDALK
jgi:hypothetical protein